MIRAVHVVVPARDEERLLPRCLASLEVAPLFTDILERVSTGNLDRVRLNSSLEQAVTLLAANAQLLRNGGGVCRGLLRVSHGYKG